DRGCPLQHRRFHVRCVRPNAYRQARVGGSVGGDRPAVVQALAWDIDLVAAPRPVLILPYQTTLRLYSHALSVAMAEGPDFRLPLLILSEGIVSRHASVVVEP